jgi:hypothetical protein
MTQPTDKRFVMEPRLDSEVVVLNDAIDLKANLTDARLTDTRTPTDNSVTSAKIVDGTIVDADINAAAAIAVSKLAPIPLDALSDVVISGVVDKQTLQYELSSLSWKNKVASGGVTATDTKPTSAINGDAWLDTNDGTLYVYYTDVNTSQWIQVVANSALEGTILARLGSLESQAIAYGNPKPNVIINGAFDIWQRGTSQTTPANGNYTADRFRTTNNGNGTRVYSQLSFAGDGPSGTALLNYFRYQQTAAGTGATYNGIAQRIENVGTLAGQTSTFSFYAKADAARTISVGGYQDSGASGTGSASFSFTPSTFALSTAWQRFSATVTIPSISGRTIGANSFLEIGISFPLNALQTIDIAGVQLELGSVATAFRRNAPNIQAELAACQRYYYRNPSASTYSQFGVGVSHTTTSVRVFVPFPVEMRIVPTGVEWTGTISNYNWYGAGGSPTGLSIESASTNRISAHIVVATSGATVNSAVLFVANGTTAAYLGFSAEL